MNICILQDYLRNGGTERQSLVLARRFIVEGHRVSLIRFRPGGVLAAAAADLPGSVLQPFDCGYSGFAPGLIRQLRAFSPDVILCMGREANRRGARLQAAFPQAAVVATMRTGKPLGAGFRRSLHAVSQVVANSDASADLLRSVYGVAADRISVIKNALVFPPVAAKASAHLRAEQNADPDTVVLLCSGMFRPEKNQAALLSIVAALPRDLKWQLWLAGAGQTEAACRSMCAQLKLGNRVKFLGFQANPSALYQAADLAVLTSRRESLSNFLIEAQAHGLPAVAYAATGVDECLDHGRSGQVVPMEDAKAFGAALTPLITDADRRAQWSERARDFARTAFDPVERARDYLRLFEQLRSGNHERGKC